MAGARLEKIGTIFARMNALIKKNVRAVEDKPIWYEIYALHPPHNEPRYDQETPKEMVREILYEEDMIRAKFHERTRKRYETIDLNSIKYDSKTKQFINFYGNLKKQGALDEEKIYEVAFQQLKSQNAKQIDEVLEDEIEAPLNIGLAGSFAKAIEKNKSDDASPTASTDDQAPKPDPQKKSDSIDVKSLF